MLFRSNSKYLYYILEMALPAFLQRYQTGLNINPEIFKHLKFAIHPDVMIQDAIVTILDSMSAGLRNEEQVITQWGDIKQIHLDGMFV